MTSTADVTADALYRGILANPADDAPRLVYADWLDENGEPEYASFIRVQVELARLEEILCHQPGAALGDWCNDSLCPKCGPAYALRRREQELWVNESVRLMDWCNSVGLDFQKEWPFVVRRGFPDSVRLTLAAFLPPCGRCEGRGQYRFEGVHDAIDDSCPDCSGSGRVPGVAKALGGLPLRADGVTLVDREPLAVDHREPVAFRWLLVGNEDVSHRAFIPVELFNLLAGAVEGAVTYRGYPTRAAADRALATAAVALARERAGIN